MSTDNKHSVFFFRNQLHFLRDNYNIHDEALYQAFHRAVENFCYFTFEMDKLIDGDYNYEKLFESNVNLPYHAVKSHQESILSLGRIFPAADNFWKELDQKNLLYYSTLIKEKYNALRQPAQNLEDFENYAIGKHALAYIPITGMDCLFDPIQDPEKLKEAYTLIFKGMQMNDDLEDFNEDIMNHQWTYARSRVNTFVTENGLTNDKHLDKFEERVLYVSGIAEELIQYSKRCFTGAKNIAEKYNFHELKNWLIKIIHDIDQNEQLIISLTRN